MKDPRTYCDICHRIAEGAMKVFRTEIQGAYNLADIWIEERNKKELKHE